MKISNQIEAARKMKLFAQAHFPSGDFVKECEQLYEHLCSQSDPPRGISSVALRYKKKTIDFLTMHVEKYVNAIVKGKKMPEKQDVNFLFKEMLQNNFPDKKRLMGISLGAMEYFAKTQIKQITQNEENPYIHIYCSVAERLDKNAFRYFNLIK